MLKITDLSLQRGTKQILQNADLTLFPKEKLGLIGQNGAGKSTLLAAIRNEIPHERGQIDIPAAWKTASIAQTFEFADQTVLNFVLAGDEALQSIKTRLAQAEQTGQSDSVGELYSEMESIDGYTAESRAATILHGLGFKQTDLSRPAREFSGGWQMRMALARVLGSRAELMLLDEPTNHLDVDAVVWLEDWLRNLDATVIVVSHDRDFLDAVSTHTVHLSNLQLTKYTGGYSDFEQAFAQRQQQIEQANRKASAEREHLQKFVDRFKAKASKAKQAQSRVKRLEKIQQIEMFQVERAPEIFFPEPQKSPDPLVSLQRASCGYSGNKEVLSNVSIEIRPGDRLGLLGANGNGKTTLVKSLVGELSLLNGERVEGKGLVCGYFAQNEIEALDLGASPLTHLQRLDRNATEQSLRNFLARFHFADDKVHQEVRSFSGGEKSRLALAMIAYLRPNLLLLDEPTNHLDMASRQSLAKALLEFAGALVVVSHDRHLLESITDSFLWVHAGRVEPFDGDLSDYTKALKAPTALPAQANSAQTPNTSSQTQSLIKDHKLIKQLKNQIKKLEEQLIPTLLKKISELDQALASIDYNATDAATRASTLSEQKIACQQQMAQLEEELLEAMLTLEEE